MADIQDLIKKVQELTEALQGRRPKVGLDTISTRDIEGAKRVWSYLAQDPSLHGHIVFHCWPGPAPGPIETEYPLIFTLLEEALGGK